MQIKEKRENFVSESAIQLLERALTVAAEKSGSDSDVLNRFERGDDGAYEELYKRYYDMTRRFVRSVAKGMHNDIEDVVSDVWLRILRKQIDGQCSFDGSIQRFVGFLRITARRVTIDTGRELRAKLQTDSIEETRADGLKLADKLQNRSVSVEQEVEDRTILAEALAQLTAGEKELVFALHTPTLPYLGDYTLEEWSELTGVPKGTIYSRAKRILEKLQNKWETIEHGFDGSPSKRLR